MRARPGGEGQDLPVLAGAFCSLQRQAGMLQSQAVAQVQTGSHWQLQFWQAQAALDEAVGLVGLFFMDDMVSSLSTEPGGESYRGGGVFFKMGGSKHAGRAL